MNVYGVNPVLEALRSRARKVERVLITRGKSGGRLERIIQLSREQGIPVRFEPSDAIKRQAGTAQHQDAVAILAEAPLVDLQQILDEGPDLLLIVDSVEDPRNLGAVLRSAEAAGVQGVLLPDRRTCPLNAAAVKSSAGAALHLPIARIGNVSQTLAKLKQAGLWIAGLDADGDLGPSDLDASLPLAVVVGGEHRGLRPLVRKGCDFLVSLPMCGRVNSLNLSVAAAILLYQIVLGRRKGTRLPPSSK